VKARAVRAATSPVAPAAAPAPPPLPRRSQFLLPAIAAVIIIAGTWAYATSFGGVFLLDDVRAIVRNPTIRTLWPPTTPLSPPHESTVAGRPVANLSFAVSYAIGSSTPAALDAAAFHAVNLLIHLTTALVLVGVVRRTLLSPRLRPTFGTAAPWIGGAIALIWVVHPLQTAAVTYVVQRVESLMGLLYLLTLYCAIRATEGRQARAWSAAAIVACAAGMGTKETMVTAPIVVALWDHFFGAPRPGGRGHVRWSLLAGLAASWMLLGVLVRQQFRGPSINLDPSIVWLYVRTQAEVVVHYLRLAFAPTRLVFFYDWPLTPAPLWMAWQAAFLLALLALTVLAAVRRHPAGFLGAWFFLILAPSSSVLPIVTEVAAEHRMYLPSAAVITGVVVALFVVVKRYVKQPTAALSAAAAALVAVAIVLGAATHARNRVYWSAEGLWKDTVEKRPADARPHIAYGEALASAGKLAEAEAQLRTGTELAPQDAFAHVRLGAVLAQQRKFEPAISHLVTALAVRPRDADAHRLLAEIRALQHEDVLAVEHYRQALAMVPDDARLLAGLATILAESRDLTVRDPIKGRDLADRAVSITGGRDPRALEVLSGAQAACGYLAEAARTARAAAAVARAMGDTARAGALEYRAAAYDRAAGQRLAPGR